MNRFSAIAFVHQHATPLELARLRYILDSEPAPLQVVARLLSGQRPDGGWAPFWAQDYSSLDATCFHLAQAEALGLQPEHPALRRAVQFLVRRQHSDGSWEEEESLAPLTPPWAKPGDPASRLYLTANCGFWLGNLTKASHDARQSGNYLKLHLNDAGYLPASRQANWLAAGLWFQLGEEKLTDKVFQYLTSDLGELYPSNLAWLLTTLLVAGLKPEHPLLSQAAGYLERQQNEDGSWSSEDGPKFTVHTTLEALRSLKLCGHF